MHIKSIVVAGTDKPRSTQSYNSSLGDKSVSVLDYNIPCIMKYVGIHICKVVIRRRELMNIKIPEMTTKKTRKKL